MWNSKNIGHMKLGTVRELMHIVVITSRVWKMDLNYKRKGINFSVFFKSSGQYVQVKVSKMKDSFFQNHFERYVCAVVTTIKTMKKDIG